MLNRLPISFAKKAQGKKEVLAYNFPSTYSENFNKGSFQNLGKHDYLIQMLHSLPKMSKASGCSR